MNATYAVYYAIGLAISAPAAKYSVAWWNIVAQADGVIPSLPNGSDTVATAALGGVIAWLLGKVIPKLSDDHKEAMIQSAKTHADSLDNLSEKMEGVRAEIRAGNDSQLALLRNVLHQGKQQA
jgi:hypothetical protein